jgi:hypothetical protein
MAEKIDDTRLCNIVKDLVSDAEKYRDERSIDREKAMAFFDGDAKDLAQYIPYDEGRSKVVSRDVRAAVRKVLPSVLRTSPSRMRSTMHCVCAMALSSGGRKKR